MSAVPILEAEFQAQVLELAKILGWRTAHFRAARTAKGWRTPVGGDGKGFPDLVLLRGDRLIVAELKTKEGTVTPEQWAWIEAFEEADVEAHIWKPQDFDVIAGLLR